MAKFFDEIPPFVATWIKQQKMFWVATAPLSRTGHVNVSPKGFDGTFHIVDEKTVWYEDLTGSGIETISHIRENGRVTIMFCAFEGPPQIVRLFGYGKVYEFGTPEYNELIPLEKRQPGSRSIIMLDIHKVGTSCGYSIPFYTFKTHRMRLHQGMARAEGEDINADISDLEQTEDGLAPKGLKSYWKKNNTNSIDGLPGIQTAYKTKVTFDKNVAERSWAQDEEGLIGEPCLQTTKAAVSPVGNWVEPKVVAAFMLGVAVTASWSNLVAFAGSKVRQ